MKKQLFFAAVALVALASCSSEEIIGDSPTPNPNSSPDNAIVFNSGAEALTRTTHVGADAASLLNKKFYVVSFNGNGTTMSQTFDNYLVEWTQNTAGKTLSNTSDWEYVSKTAPAWSGIAGNTQTIKYWDYSKDQYDFIAWSPGTASVVPAPDEPSDPASGTVQITKPSAGSYAPTYSLKGASADLAKCYIADMVTAYKADQSTPQPKYQEEVKFTFRSLACKVRVALYETIPGYSVKDVKFYTDGTTGISTGASATNATLYTTGSAANNKFYTAGTYTISFPTKGSANISSADYNKAHVTFSPTATGTDTKESFGALTLVGPETGGHEATGDQYLGRTLPNASYAKETGAENYYKIMLPNETGTVLQLRVDYTLVPTDGADETITIHGATAYVPQIYAAWKPNFAYTYVFKISDNTNGWTSTVNTDPAGLFPITFDAIVIDSEENTQSTITTVATPSITTYQKGHDVTLDEYLHSTAGAKDSIYVQVMNATTLAADLNSKGKLYTLTGITNPTEADVMDALNIQVSEVSGTITGRNDLVLTPADQTFATGTTTFYIPGVDGNYVFVDANTAARFLASAGTYAYVYDTGTYGGQKYNAAPAGFPTGYWTDDKCTYTASSTFNSEIMYYRKESTISSYVEYTSAPSDWKTDTSNPYYRDEACTIQVTGEFSTAITLNSMPADWVSGSSNVYFSDASCTTPVTAAYANGTYYKKGFYRKYTVSNKIYGVKVIKVV